VTDLHAAGLEAWAQYEVEWWAEVKVRGYVQAYVDAMHDDVNALEVAVDEMVRARLKAEAALERAQGAADRAEDFAKLAGQVIDRPLALVEAAERLTKLEDKWRKRR
jgi:hypothetical protein